MEDDYYDIEKPECPYCEDNIGSCSHLLLEYDASFIELIDGYLTTSESCELENLKEVILELVKSNVEPKFKSHDYFLKSIWDNAVENYKPNCDEIQFDYTAYFNWMEIAIAFFNGSAFRFEEEDCAPGYSSTYIIFYALNPKETIEQINNWIIKRLKS